MVTLLHFILIMILTAGIIVGIAIYIIYTRVKNAARNFRAQFGGSSKGQRRPKQTHTSDGEIIVHKTEPAVKYSQKTKENISTLKKKKVPDIFIICSLQVISHPFIK